MKYGIPFLLDSNNQLTGLFALYTTEGPIIFIFTNQNKMERFGKIASNMAAQSGNKFGWVDFQASSFSNVVSQLVSMDSSLAGSTNFIPDSDPFFDQILMSLRDRIP
jgi:hypothetical protein